MKKTLYSLMLSEEVVREVDALAHRLGTNRSNLINQILADYVSVTTPERRINDIFRAVEQMLAPSRELVPFFAPNALTMSLKSSLEYKYRPTVKYEVQLFRSGEGSLGELSVGYMMRKPCDIPATAARIGDLSRHIRAPLVTPPDPQTQVTNLLLSLNIPSKLRGYAYLREAIPRMMKDPDQPITKVLYPAVGAVFGCKGTHVERSIRSAIDTAWKQRDDRVWQRYFRVGSDGVIPRPSNAAFISRLADALRLNQDAGNNEE